MTGCMANANMWLNRCICQAGCRSASVATPGVTLPQGCHTLAQHELDMQPSTLPHQAIHAMQCMLLPHSWQP
jgi:hypothetical protein